MSHTNCKINISVNKKTYSIFYTYNRTTTFYDLLEYFAYICPSLNICKCCKFYIFKDEELFNISRSSKLSQCEKYLNNLKIIKNEADCKHSNENNFLYNKIDLISLFESDIKEYKNTIKEKEKQYSDLKKEYSKIISEKNNEIKKLEDKITKLELSVNGDYRIINFLEKNGIKKTKNLEVKQGLYEINKENGQYVINNLKLEEKQEHTEFYDVIVKIESIKDINKGWTVQMSEKGKKNYELYKDKNALKIGVIGNANKGKSFLLSKISKMNLPSGTTIKTEGLSIKYPDLEIHANRKIVLLDSAGLETPVLAPEGILEESKKNELFKDKCREKLITELFLQNYIINNSDILIVVVDSLSFSEQKLLLKIKKEMERSKKQMPLYIIHNLKTYTSIKQVEDYIEETLKKSATFTIIPGENVNTKIETNSGVYFFEKKIDEKEQNIFHLIYANEKSEAGNYYNYFTLNFIEKCYQGITNLKKFDIIESLKERFINVYEEIIEKSEKNEKITKDSFDSKPNSYIIKLKNEEEITLKKCLIDELGFSNLKSNGFEPKYNIYKKDKKVIIRVEVPGNEDIYSETENSGEYTLIKLSGEKRNDKEPDRKEDNYFTIREFGHFYFEIPLKAKDFNLKYEEPVITNKKGIFILEYKTLEKLKPTGGRSGEDEV